MTFAVSAPALATPTAQTGDPKDCSGCQGDYEADGSISLTVICSDPQNNNEELFRTTLRVTIVVIQSGDCDYYGVGPGPIQQLQCLPVPDDDTCRVRVTFKHNGGGSYTTFQCEQADPNQPKVCAALTTVPDGYMRTYVLTCGDSTAIEWGMDWTCLGQTTTFTIDLSAICTNCEG